MERNQTLDIMKGITIVLMVMGHLSFFTDGHILGQGILWRVTYSFHMPLFFILAGYFYSEKGTIKKDLSRIMLPYAIVAIVLLMTVYVAQLADIQSVRYIMGGGIFRNAFWGSGWYHQSKYFGDVPPYCVMWFLPAMFWCKSIFRGLEKRIKDKALLGLICLSIALIAVYVVNPWVYLPLSFNEGLSALVFYYIGYVAKRKQLEDFRWPIYGIAAIIAGIAYGHGTLGMDCCYYQSYIICLVGAISGTVLMHGVSKLVNKVKYLNTSVAWLGKASMLILCVHASMFVLCDVCKQIGNPYIVLLIIEACAIGGALALSYIPIVKKIFKL